MRHLFPSQGEPQTSIQTCVLAISPRSEPRTFFHNHTHTCVSSRPPVRDQERFYIQKHTQTNVRPFPSPAGKIHSFHMLTDVLSPPAAGVANTSTSTHTCVLSLPRVQSREGNNHAPAYAPPPSLCWGKLRMLCHTHACMPHFAFPWVKPRTPPTSTDACVPSPPCGVSHARFHIHMPAWVPLPRCSVSQGTRGQLSYD